MDGMSLKVSVTWILGVGLLADRSRAGVISLEAGALQEHSHVSLASSYMHFYGPVEGPEFEVKVPHVLHHAEHNDIHGQDHEDYRHGYAIDYVAHPRYQFSYGVEDHHTGDFHSQKESRDGSDVSGEYSVMEPGGTVRVVSYRAGKDGFHAVVHTSGRNEHRPSGSHAHHFQEDHGLAHQQHAGEGEVADAVHDYAAGYTAEGYS